MLRLVVSNQTNPHLNVAVENYLLALPETDVVTLYLWKNHRTVVVGKNQNPFAECNVELLENEGGYLMRRSTGGGAVFHDDGNLNFSFIIPKDLYDQHRQFSVLQKAVASYGLDTELSGRNDVLCQGRKFSGNAFSKGRHQNLHHGTILIKGNIEDMQRYLRPKPAKLQRHGVQSVHSRVVNLSELADVTSQNIVPRLITAFEQVYGGQAVETSFEEISQYPEVQKLYKQFSSDEWLYGRWRQFQAQHSAQFEWGGVELQLDIDEEHHIIRSLQMATDGLNLSIIDRVHELLDGASIEQPPAIPDNLPEEEQQVVRDIISLIY
ncbi:MAG: lipoate--protein ligase [Bacteroidales bacterium]|nr:lipoate--protein ligase [Bacteroidales bacterium]